MSQLMPELPDELSEGFPPQPQEPPGMTDEMSPVPDHGENSYQGSGKLTGLNAVITGGDSGIGRAVAIAFAREGADIAISYLPEEDQDAKTTEDHILEAGRRCVLVPGDLTERTHCDQLIRTAVSGLGSIDVLVNNAGFQMGINPGLEQFTDEQLDRVIKTNVYALFWVTRAALPYLSAGSSVINTASVQAYHPSPSLMDYAGTKAAIVNITINLATKLGPAGIRVNSVLPGPIWTPLQPSTRSAERLQTFGQDTPLGRAGQPAEVAPAFVFLASPRDASYVSGTVLGVTGGKGIF